MYKKLPPLSEHSFGTYMVAEQCELFITSPLQDIRRKLYALLRRLGGSKKDIGAAYRSIIYNINGHHDSKGYKKTWSFCHYYVCMLLSKNRPTWFLRCLYYPASTTVTIATEGGLKMPAPTSYISILKKKNSGNYSADILLSKNRNCRMFHSVLVWLSAWPGEWISDLIIA